MKNQTKNKFISFFGFNKRRSRPGVSSKILNNKNYLYHKTEFDSAKQLVESGKFNTGQFSFSEGHNPNVIYKKYKQPTVLVFNKRKLKDVKKVDYNNKTSSLQWENEREWITKNKNIGPAIVGAILNEHDKLISRPDKDPGFEDKMWMSYPTRYVRSNRLKTIKFKTQDDASHNMRAATLNKEINKGF